MTTDTFYAAKFRVESKHELSEAEVREGWSAAAWLRQRWGEWKAPVTRDCHRAGDGR